MERPDSVEWARRAKALRPALYHQTVEPVRVVTPVRDDAVFQGWKMETVPDAPSEMHTGDVRCWDLGRHMAGHFSFRISLVGTRQDAPVKLRLTFGEMPCELAESLADYHGWISAAWFQEETLIIDRLPQTVTLPRRYAFRYVKIEVLAASVRFGVLLDGFACDATTSADMSAVRPFDTLPQKYRDIDRVALDTLRDCMQEIFEDGPKRDRRLWLGDLRLQALVSYDTCRRDDLVRRCLCMFAAAPLADGRLPASVYDFDPPLDDESCLQDYALLFVSTVWDYLAHTGDEGFAGELYPIALEQLRIAHDAFLKDGVMTYEEGFTCFIDWCQDLDKHAALQGVYLYALEHGALLAQRLGHAQDAAMLRQWCDEGKQAALRAYWDESAKHFVSGAERQVSWASQIWLVLGGALDREQAAALLKRALKAPPSVAIVTPYLKHYLVEALLVAGLKDEALQVIDEYWGGMVRLGADTFWEIYKPENPNESPYGGNMSHSYCHAWSCTPAYFLRQIFAREARNDG